MCMKTFQATAIFRIFRHYNSYIITLTKDIMLHQSIGTREKSIIIITKAT